MGGVDRSRQTAYITLVTIDPLSQRVNKVYKVAQLVLRYYKWRYSIMMQKVDLMLWCLMNTT